MLLAITGEEALLFVQLKIIAKVREAAKALARVPQNLGLMLTPVLRLYTVEQELARLCHLHFVEFFLQRHAG